MPFVESSPMPVSDEWMSRELAAHYRGGYARRMGDEQADLADAMQANAFRAFLDRERRELVAEHAKLVRIGDARCSILRVEGDIRHIDRMLAALVRRFPVDEEVRRRA